MKQQLIFFCILFLSALNAGAQDQSESVKEFQVGFIPHYAIYHGAAFDIEKRIKDKDQYLQFRPHFYYDRNEVNYSGLRPPSQPDYEELLGFGLGVFHKRIVYRSPKDIVHLHFSYGAEYTHLTMDYKSFTWSEFTENDLQYYQYALEAHKRPIDRIRVSLNIGIQINIAQSLYFGSYIGSGFIYSITEVDELKYVEDMDDYAFSGITIPVGFRIGVLF